LLGPLIAFAAGLTLSLVCGGSLEQLGEARFRRLPLFWLGVSVSLVLAFGPGELLTYGVALVLVSNLLMIGFAVSNHHVPGLVVVGVGIFLNAVVIGLNGAMPVSPEAARTAAASTQEVGSIKHEPMTVDTRFPVLADRVPVEVTGQVWSLGDFILVLGIGWMGFSLPRRRNGVPIAPPQRSAAA
jgi:Family of unknown function (DUF5317)